MDMRVAKSTKIFSQKSKKNKQKKAVKAEKVAADNESQSQFIDRLAKAGIDDTLRFLISDRLRYVRAQAELEAVKSY